MITFFIRDSGYNIRRWSANSGHHNACRSPWQPVIDRGGWCPTFIQKWGRRIRHMPGWGAGGAGAPEWTRSKVCIYPGRIPGTPGKGDEWRCGNILHAKYFKEAIRGIISKESRRKRPLIFFCVPVSELVEYGLQDLLQCSSDKDTCCTWNALLSDDVHTPWG